MAERKRINKKTQKQPPKTGMTSELWAIIIIAVGIIAGLCFYTDAATSPLGKLLNNFGLGLLGLIGYVLPLLAVVFGIHYLLQKDFKPYRRYYLLTCGILVLLSSIIHLFFGCLDWDFAAFYTDHTGGGIIGGLLAVALQKLGGTAVAAVILCILLLLAVAFITGISIADIMALFHREKVEKEDEYAPPIKPQEERKKHKPVPKEEPTKNDETDDDDFDFEKIKIFSHDQLSIDNVAEADEKKTDKNDEKKEEKKEEKPEGKPAETAVAVSEIEQEITKVQTVREYVYPSLDMLELHRSADTDKPEDLRQNAKKLIDTLKSFGVEAKVLEVSRGPSVTRYEIQPSAGVKVSKIVNLADDIALNLAAFGVRIEAPIPGKAAVGIEIPNKNISTVSLRDVLESKEFQTFSSKTAFALGKDISGITHVGDVAKMPHLLIAGATGSGKSVCINTLISSLVYKATPAEVKLLMIDPKVVELGVYNGIPHLLIPVVTEPRKAAGALNWAVTEMIRRYKMFAECNVRDIRGYNEFVATDGEPSMEKIVIIIDELADLMMAAPHEVEEAICRIAQMGRAAGMHLVIATQRPSVDVITGLIKANIPSRIAFAVSSQIDSRTILDMMGAEKLLGRGDMLYLPFGASKPVRLQGAFVSDKEVEHIVEFIKGGEEPVYDEDIIDRLEQSEKQEDDDPGDNDELLPQAIEIVVECGQASVSLIQRRMKVGYARAGRMVDQMEARGIVGPHEGSKPRQVLLTKQQYYEMMMNSD